MNASFKADVQEYLGWPNAEVEGTLKAFRAAIAYVTPLGGLWVFLWCLVVDEG